jgi:hypothetical protein
LEESEVSNYIEIDSGFNYVTDDSVAMVEYHIDASIGSFLDEQLYQRPFGGNLSIRKPLRSNTVMLVGQDEAIKKQFLFDSTMCVMKELKP